MASRIRLLRPLLPWFQHSQRQLHDLRFLFFELTHECNLDCLHCGSDCRKGSVDTPLPAKDVVRVLTEVKAHLDPRRITITLSGGEPLCYPNVFGLGGQIAALGFPWGMVTNGYAWSRKQVCSARQAGLRSITVSLDGLAAEHDWLRNRSGAFERAVETLRLLLAEPFWQALDVVTCVNRRNVNQLAELHDFLHELGVPAWRCFTISPIGRAADREELFLTRREFTGMLETIRALRLRKAMSVSYSEAGYLGPQHEEGVRDFPYFCRAGINVAGVMVNGDILACPNIDRRFRQGNIAQDSFIEVWNHRYTAFRDRAWMKQGECGNCGEWRYCQGNSLHLWDLDRNRTRLCHYRSYCADEGDHPAVPR
jgi:radical SAM enzyme (rSAM/lipoprotein system)